MSTFIMAQSYSEKILLRNKGLEIRDGFLEMIIETKALDGAYRRILTGMAEAGEFVFEDPEDPFKKLNDANERFSALGIFLLQKLGELEEGEEQKFLFPTQKKVHLDDIQQRLEQNITALAENEAGLRLFYFVCDLLEKEDKPINHNNVRLKLKQLARLVDIDMWVPDGEDYVRTIDDISDMLLMQQVLKLVIEGKFIDGISFDADGPLDDVRTMAISKEHYDVIKGGFRVKE